MEATWTRPLRKFYNLMKLFNLTSRLSKNIQPLFWLLTCENILSVCNFCPSLKTEGVVEKITVHFTHMIHRQSSQLSVI